MLIGVVGKANVGKSTFFKAATMADAEIANYPFTTIKPNRAMAFVKVKCVEEELNVKCEPREGYCVKGNRFVPVELMDVAGLVPGASEGKGMGNQFLDDLRQADALIHVIDISGSVNEKGEPVEPLSYDPLKDVEFLENEIDAWYLGLVRKGWDKFTRQVKQENAELHKAIAKQLSGLMVTIDIAEEAIKKISKEDIMSWTESDLKTLARELRLKTKPMIIAANKIDVAGSDKNLERVKQQCKDHIIVPCSAESELALKEAAKKGLIDYIPGERDFKIASDKLSEKQLKALDFIRNSVLKSSSTGVQDVLDAVVFKLLNYIAIFPGSANNLKDSKGRTLPDCFLLREGTTALDFAYKLHTDFGKNFVRAVDVRKKLTVGKNHILKHRDIIEIISAK